MALRLPIAAAWLVPLALAIVVEQVATVGLSIGGGGGGREEPRDTVVIRRRVDRQDLRPVFGIPFHGWVFSVFEDGIIAPFTYRAGQRRLQ
ncbi:hypothetical protein OPV22_032282 [Ensete ventricosum]|uniref:Uncharacterized protein n=1 Tax=Ensete ventricosum TaxID=4639 RepID=A0AAV8NZZ5_ENSVE|nr:hypothetical protein OPV22_032282 [Ensete ventricosum]